MVAVPPGGTSVVEVPLLVMILFETYTILPLTEGLLYRGVNALNTWAFTEYTVVNRKKDAVICLKFIAVDLLSDIEIRTQVIAPLPSGK